MRIHAKVKWGSTQSAGILLCTVASLLLGSGDLARATGSVQDTVAKQDRSRGWGFTLSGLYYLLPGDADIPVITATGDRDRLHLEARYNYEGLRTGSAFVGWNLSGGGSLEFEVTPMAGVAIGKTTGLIPALRLSLAYGIADFYAESEYLYNFDGAEGNFFYSWLELGVTPVDLIRAGAVAQRTRIVQSPLEIDRGIFAQVTPGPGSVSLYAFNLLTESWFLVIAVAVNL